MMPEDEIRDLKTQLAELKVKLGRAERDLTDAELDADVAKDCMEEAQHSADYADSTRAALVAAIEDHARGILTTAELYGRAGLDRSVVATWAA